MTKKKVNFDLIIKDLRDDPLLDPKGKPWTAGGLAAEALLAPLSRPDGVPRGPTQIAERFALALRLLKGGDQTYTDPEGNMIQEAVSENCAPIAAARIIALMEG